MWLASLSASGEKTSGLFGATVAARAIVQTNEPDADALDNSTRVLTEVDPAADLSVRLTDTPDPVRVRERLTYGDEVVNVGPSSDAAA